MLTTEERKKTVDFIVEKVAERGKLTFETEISRTYELGLPYCTLKVRQMLLPPECTPVIDIAENFGNPNFEPANWQDLLFDGVRLLYKGGYDGVEEVALQGIQLPLSTGKTIPPAESLRRFKDSMDGRSLTRQDMERYDAFLNYARREL